MSCLILFLQPSNPALAAYRESTMEEHKAIYGLVGYPVEHSLSPLMHNAAFTELGVDAVYNLFSLKEDEVAPFFEDLKEKDNPIFGVNVTVPYKEKVIPFLDHLSPFAKKVMAVNTVVIAKDRQLTGFNTDGPGFLAHLAELKFEVGEKRVSLIGAGGAARAIVAALCLVPEGPESIRIFDVDQIKAQRLVDDLGERMDTAMVSVARGIDDLNIELCDLLINATPIGMKSGDKPLVEPELLHPDMLVYDLIYNPAQTALLKTAQQRGATTANGLGMLFYQGVLAFQHWAEIQLDKKIKDKMRASLEAGIKYDRK